MDKTGVSVIIPFKNNHSEVVQIVEQIRAQDYPDDRIEIICIDNGSDVQSTIYEELKKRFRLLQETDHPNSPYSARNRGIEASRGGILVFVDANSEIRSPNWLSSGLECMEKQSAAIAAGKVSFDFGENVTAAGIADALTSIKMKQAVEERGVAYTANLFIKKELFEKVGLFEEGVRSGGDVRWTLKASEMGYKPVYCPAAEVFKKARSAKVYYKKKIRTGRGYYHTWKIEVHNEHWAGNLLRSLKPPSFAIENLNPERYQAEFDSKKPVVWFHLYLSRILEQLSFVREYFRNK